MEDSKPKAHYIQKVGELIQQLGADPGNNIDIVCQEACRLFQVSLTLYCVFNAEKSRIAYRIARPDTKIVNETYDPHGLICFETISQQKSELTYFSDLSHSDFAHSDPIVKKYDLRSMIICPVLLDSKVYGAFCIADSEVREFLPNEITLIASLAKILAIEHERMAVHNLVEEEEVVYKTLFDHSHDAILVIDQNGVITDANQKASELFACTYEQLTGTHLSGFLFREQFGVTLQPDFSCDYLAGLVEKNSLLQINWQMIRKHGLIFQAELSFSQFKVRNESYCFVLIRDLTKQIETEKHLTDARYRAEEADRLKSAFLANMSHEIRTPLNSIIGFSELIMDEDTNKDEKEYFLTLISSAGRTLLQLIDDIIDISKIEAGQIKVTESRSEVNAILDELKVNYDNERVKRKKLHISLRLHKAYDGEFFLMTDPFRFRQIMMNLITNALKFVDEGFIEFGYTDMNNDQVQFFVKDTGIGIEKDKSHLIFQRFGQIDTAYKRNLDGTGLGLAITHNLVGLLGGKIWFDSEPQKGTTFYFTLPASVSLQKSSFASVNYGRIMYDWSDKVFLIVDDVEANYFFLKAVFRDSKALLLWAKNGTEAVKICRNNTRIDLVLMDIIMPEMDGYEAVAQIRKFAPKLPVIAQSAFAGENEHDVAVQKGCQAWISKPVSKTELASIIKKLLE